MQHSCGKKPYGFLRRATESPDLLPLHLDLASVLGCLGSPHFVHGGGARSWEAWGPENAAYDRYSPRLHKHAASLISEWVDAVLFATKRLRISKDGDSRSIASPIGADGGTRVLRTNGSPACLAKNRFGLPNEIPLNWDAFIEAYRNAVAPAAS